MRKFFALAATLLLSNSLSVDAAALQNTSYDYNFLYKTENEPSWKEIGRNEIVAIPDNATIWVKPISWGSGTVVVKAFSSKPATCYLIKKSSTEGDYGVYVKTADSNDRRQNFIGRIGLP